MDDRPNLSGERTKGGPSTRTERLFLAAVLAIAFAVRLIYVLQSRESPFFDAPQLDEAYHVRWARAFAGGQTFVDGPFFRAPLYPWFLGCVHAVFGGAKFFLAARVLQALLGTVSTLLVQRIARRLFDARTSLIAALFFALYWVPVFFDGELLIPTLAVPLNLAALLFTLRARHDAIWSSAALAGLFCGLAAIARPNVLLWAPFALFGLAFLERRPRASLAFAAGLALMVLPISALNVARGDAVLISSQAGVNLWIGNHPGADGTSAVLPGVRPDLENGVRDARLMAEAAQGRRLAPSEVSRHYAAKTATRLVEQPGAMLRLALWKLRLFVSSVELSNNKPVRFFATQFGGITRYLPVSWHILFPLAMLGLAVSIRKKATWPASSFLLTYSASVLLFFVNARFRVPILPLVCVFAAAGGSWLIAAARSRSRALLPALAFVAASAALAVVPPGEVELGRREDGSRITGRVETSDAQGWWLLGVASQSLGELDQAALLYQRALDESPRLWVAQRDLGRVRLAQARPAEAQSHLEAAIAIHADASIFIALVDATLALGQRQRALDVAEQLRYFAPALPDADYQEGRIHFAAGDWKSASQSFSAALKIAPQDFNAAFALGKTLAQQGDFPRALEAYDVALGAPNANVGSDWFWAAALERGQLLVRNGQTSEARAQALALLDRFPDDPRAKALLDAVD